MSKEKSMQPKLLQEDFLANHSALQEKENQQQMIVTSGMKCLESLEKQNQDGLLEKMLKVLLTSTKAWYSDRCLLTWKTKVSKANVLLFQLQASVHGIKEKGSGLSHVMFQTPTVTEIPARSKEAMEKRIAFRKSIGRNSVPAGNLLEQIQTMFPTPSASCHMDVVAPPETVTQNNQGWSVTRVGTGTKFGAKLNDVVNKLDQEKLGGKLNPNFVEFLMGYPMNWTKIDPTE